MKYLVDTCTLLWYFQASEKLPENITKIFFDEPNENLYVSIISIYEVAIKYSIGKLDFSGGVKELIRKIQDVGLSIIEIKKEYAEILENLPFIHKEPFDRMIIATAKYENMTILTADTKIHQYDVKTLWK
jgi:PIN domain nuclease of toxin-antitoxin system